MSDPVAILSALAEPTRLAAMQLLADGGEHCVCELMRTLGASQSRMSRHMAVLKSAGLVLDRRDAQWVRYKLNPAMPQPVATILSGALAVSSQVQRTAA